MALVDWVLLGFAVFCVDLAGRLRLVLLEWLVLLEDFVLDLIDITPIPCLIFIIVAQRPAQIRLDCVTTR
ncbi:MAG: hypothetical protein U0931_22935 [Vulcanimicrobiota bacterium]